MTAHYAKVRTRSRKRQRGAALVEAGVVMPVLVLFLGLTVFTYQEFTVKQETMIDARHAAFAKAFHANCGGSGNIGNGFPIPMPSVMGITVPILAPLQYALDFMSTTTTETRSGTAVGGGRSRGLSTKSYTYCSPKSMMETLTSFVDAILDKAKSILPF